MSLVGGLVVAGPIFMGKGGQAFLKAAAELVGPVGLLLLPVSLILLIRVLSSGYRLGDIFGLAMGESLDAAYRVGQGSSAAVALALLILLLFAYYRLFGGDDE